MFASSAQLQRQHKVLVLEKRESSNSCPASRVLPSGKAIQKTSSLTSSSFLRLLRTTTVSRSTDQKHTWTGCMAVCCPLFSKNWTRVQLCGSFRLFSSFTKIYIDCHICDSFCGIENSITSTDHNDENAGSQSSCKHYITLFLPSSLL
jgi:hypothetical protein